MPSCPGQVPVYGLGFALLASVHSGDEFGVCWSESLCFPLAVCHDCIALLKACSQGCAQALQDALAALGKITGQHLNPQKSTILPIGIPSNCWIKLESNKAQLSDVQMQGKE